MSLETKDMLLNSLKKAKGYYIYNSDASTINFIKIVELSKPYNSTTYFGSSVISKIKAAGGEECAGGLGSSLDPDDPLTKEICNKYNLSCK